VTKWHQWQKGRKSFTLEEKLCVIKRFERNERAVDIANAMGFAESTSSL
jgi:hypothetical protein